VSRSDVDAADRAKNCQGLGRFKVINAYLGLYNQAMVSESVATPKIFPLCSEDAWGGSCLPGGYLLTTAGHSGSRVRPDRETCQAVEAHQPRCWMRSDNSISTNYIIELASQISTAIEAIEELHF
jgi:hypothetical protein